MELTREENSHEKQYAKSKLRVRSIHWFHQYLIKVRQIKVGGQGHEFARDMRLRVRRVARPLGSEN